MQPQHTTARQRKTIERPCDICSNPYTARLDSLARHGVGYCSRSCANRGRIQKRRLLADRFWEKVDKDGSVPAHCPELGQCWVWTANQSKNGYGMMTRGGHSGPMVYTHRVSWELHFGPIPDGLWVLHKCDNRPCVRPDHLWLGTRADNMADASRKGRLIGRRHVQGESHSQAVLTVELVHILRSRYDAGESTKDLSIAFQLVYNTVDACVKRVTWRHVQP